MSKYKVALDAGHGGSDPGAVYNGRQEKDDTLDLTLAVGDILKKNGVDVFYTRTNDEYETPFKKATDANNSGADLFVSIHRNSSEKPNQYSGVETLVYNDSGLKSEVARNINNQLEDIGFKNLGVDERKNLVVLKRTKMPAVLVEAGFINNDKDNYIFDQEFDKVANAIADGILESLPVGSRNSNTHHSNSSYNKANNSNNTNSSNNANSSSNASNVNSSSNASNLGASSTFYDSSSFGNSYDSGSSYDSGNFIGTSSSINSDNVSYRYDITPKAETEGINNSDNYTADTGYNLCNDNSCNSLHNNSCSNTCNSACNNSYIHQPLYRVQTGAYHNKDNADRLLNSLLIDGFPAFIIYEDGYYKVQVGAFAELSNAIKMERRLRRFHYSTYIVV